MNRRGVPIDECGSDEEPLVRVCCDNGVSVHGPLLPDLSISLDFRFGRRLVGASGGEESVDEKVSEFVAFIEGGLEGVADIDHRFVAVGLRVPCAGGHVLVG